MVLRKLSEENMVYSKILILLGPGVHEDDLIGEQFIIGLEFIYCKYIFLLMKSPGCTEASFQAVFSHCFSALYSWCILQRN